jgi:hypothetical protein
MMECWWRIVTVYLGLPESVVNPMTRLKPQLIDTKRPKALVRRRVDMISDMITQETAPNPIANPTTNMRTARTAMYPLDKIRRDSRERRRERGEVSGYLKFL